MTSLLSSKLSKFSVCISAVGIACLSLGSASANAATIVLSAPVQSEGKKYDVIKTNTLSHAKLEKLIEVIPASDADAVDGIRKALTKGDYLNGKRHVQFDPPITIDGKSYVRLDPRNHTSEKIRKALDAVKQQTPENQGALKKLEDILTNGKTVEREKGFVVFNPPLIIGKAKIAHVNTYSARKERLLELLEVAKQQVPPNPGAAQLQELIDEGKTRDRKPDYLELSPPVRFNGKTLAFTYTHTHTSAGLAKLLAAVKAQTPENEAAIEKIELAIGGDGGKNRDSSSGCISLTEPIEYQGKQVSYIFSRTRRVEVLEEILKLLKSKPVVHAGAIVKLREAITNGYTRENSVDFLKLSAPVTVAEKAITEIGSLHAHSKEYLKLVLAAVKLQAPDDEVAIKRLHHAIAFDHTIETSLRYVELKPSVTFNGEELDHVQLLSLSRDRMKKILGAIKRQTPENKVAIAKIEAALAEGKTSDRKVLTFEPPLKLKSGSKLGTLHVHSKSAESLKEILEVAKKKPLRYANQIKRLETVLRAGSTLENNANYVKFDPPILEMSGREIEHLRIDNTPVQRLNQLIATVEWQTPENTVAVEKLKAAVKRKSADNVASEGSDEGRNSENESSGGPATPQFSPNNQSAEEAGERVAGEDSNEGEVTPDQIAPRSEPSEDEVPRFTKRARPAAAGAQDPQREVVVPKSEPSEDELPPFTKKARPAPAGAQDPQHEVVVPKLEPSDNELPRFTKNSKRHAEAAEVDLDDLPIRKPTKGARRIITDESSE